MVSCVQYERKSTINNKCIYAQIEENENSTRTYMDNYNVLWSENDQITAFMKTSLGLKYQVESEDVGTCSAKFTKVSIEDNDHLYGGVEWEHNVAYYPYDENLKCVKGDQCYILTVDFPQIQTYAENSFGNGAFPMIAVSPDNILTFRNLLGGIKLFLRGNSVIEKIKIEGNTNELLSGSAEVISYVDWTKKPDVKMMSEAMRSVELNCGEGVELQEDYAKVFIVSIPPTNFLNGFTVTITDVDDREMIVKSTSKNCVYRSSLLVMPDIQVEFPIIPLESIELSSNNSIMYIDETLDLNVTFHPYNASNKQIVWQSTDDSIVRIENGKVFAIGVGEADVIAKSVDGNHSASCHVIVKDDPNIEKFVIQTEGVSDLSPLFATISSTYSGVSNIIGKAIKLGLCYSATNMYPTENDDIVYASSLEDGTYNYEIELNPATLYYYRAIIYYDGRYFYGDAKKFTSPNLPIYHQAVDMGLSVKWSPCNLGAETTEMPGDYYAWGEVLPKGDKEKYTQGNYVYYDSLGDTYINIGKDISGTTYDAASTSLGGAWRMPTYDEVKELYNNCEWKSAKYNGKRGYLVKGSNGQYLFIVTVSCTSTFSSKLGYSQFWTSTLSDNDSYDANDSAYYLNYSYFNVSNTFMAKETLKYLGLPIRPVCN